MIPLYDENPTFLRPYATWALIAANVLAYAWQTTWGAEYAELAMFQLGFVPAALFEGATLPPEMASLPPTLTLFTSMFMHGDLFHLLGNVLFLYIFGNNVEDAMGHAPFLVFYFLCGLAATFTQGLMDPQSLIPMIGASGAVSGTLGAYFLLYPRARIIAVIPLGFIMLPVRLNAAWILGLWIGLQFAFALITDPAEPGIAWWAHVSGFLAGGALILFMRRNGVRLWGDVAEVPIGRLSQAAIQRGLKRRGAK